MTRFLGLALLLLAQLPVARAQWSPTQLQELGQLNQKYRSIDHTGLGTFWGGLKRQLHWAWLDGDTIAWDTPLFKAKQLPLYYSERAEVAPLVVILPGIFGATKASITPHTIDRFERAGAHVLVVPNLVSLEYVHAYPLYGGDIVQNEAQVIESALEFTLGKLGKKVKSVHVVAESLGTIVGAAFTAWDATHHKRVRSLTLLAPPLDLSAALTNFDGIIKEYTGVSEQCSRAALYWRLFKDFLIREIPGEMPLVEKRCLSEAVLVKAFLESAQKSYLAHAVALNDKSAYQVDSFEGFFRHYRPELWALIERKDDKLKLATWVKTIRKATPIPLRILTSQNDFLNRGVSWAQFLADTNLANDYLVILDWGGHSGFLAAPELDRVLAQTIDSI